MNKIKIGIIGAGHLGSSLAKLISKNGYQVSLSDTITNQDLPIFETFERKGNIELIEDSDFLFLCVKPSDVENVIDDINETSPTYKIIVTCLAGCTINEIDRKLKYVNPFIRCMPNLPIQFGKGTIAYTDKLLPKYELETFLSILRGPSLIPIDEQFMNITTLLAGSMPAFSAYIAKQYIDFGVEKGLDREVSKQLYLSSLEGMVEMMRGGKSEEEIIEEVSSPKGVTEKGITSMRDSGLKNCISSSLYRSLVHLEGKD